MLSQKKFDLPPINSKNNLNLPMISKELKERHMDGGDEEVNDYFGVNSNESSQGRSSVNYSQNVNSSTR